MAYEATQRLQAEMAPTERLLWSGRPPQGVRLARDEWPLLLIGVGLLGIGSFNAWEEWTAGQGMESLMHLLIPLIFVSLFLVARIFGDARKRAQTYYGISDQRVLILREKATRRLTVLQLAELPDAALKREGMDGGVIQLTADQIRRGPGARGHRRRVRRRGYRLVLESGVHSAFETLRRAQQEARNKATGNS